MTELMKRYEAETGHNAFLTYGITQAICYPTYVEWLEEQLSNQTVEKFQEIIRNQCDEISALKAQLTWRPVDYPPKVDGEYLCRWEGPGRFIALYKNKTWLVWDDELEEHVELKYLPYMYLPIPPAPEGE